MRGSLAVRLEQLYSDDGSDPIGDTHDHPCPQPKCGRRTLCKSTSGCRRMRHGIDTVPVICARCILLSRERALLTRQHVRRHHHSHCSLVERYNTRGKIALLEAYIRRPEADQPKLPNDDRKDLTALAKGLVADLWTHDCIYGVGVQGAA